MNESSEVGLSKGSMLHAQRCVALPWRCVAQRSMAPRRKHATHAARSQNRRLRDTLVWEETPKVGEVHCVHRVVVEPTRMKGGNAHVGRERWVRRVEALRHRHGVER